MNSFKFAVVALAAGAALPAGAATLATDTFGFVGYDDGTPFSYDVTLSQAPASMTYTGSWNLSFTSATDDYYFYEHTLDRNGGLLFASSLSSTPGFDTNLANYTKTSITTYSSGLSTFVPSGAPGPDNTPEPGSITSAVVDPSTYYHLKYDVGGHDYFGYVQFDSDHTLVSATYEVAGVPEPESWALLILGSGLAGATLRRTRRLAQAATARA
jgi:hypothetical protein